MNNTLIDIKKELRANMNGVASAAMRQTEDYRLNWGIEVPRIQNIAKEFEPGRSLAQTLWKESVRECRILACILMPTEDFDEEMADVWVDDIRTVEIAQYFCLLLMKRVPFASRVAFQWIASESVMRQICGYTLLCHVMRMGEMSDRSKDELLDSIASDILTQHAQLRTSVTKCLAIFASISEDNEKRAQKLLNIEAEPNKKTNFARV